MRSLSALVLMLTFSFTAIAQPYSQAIHSPSAIVQKYDYLLTAHPRAHEESFQKENQKKYREELTASLSNSSIEEVKENFSKVISKIPQKAKRDAYIKMLQNSSKEELLAFMSAPSLMNAALAGEGANFSLIMDEPLIVVTHIILTGLILFVVINAIARSTWPRFNSYAVTVQDVPYCSDYIYNQYVSSAERQIMKDEARTKCETESPRPDTCKYIGFLYNFERYTLIAQNGQEVQSNEGACTGVASYRSKKK